MCCSPCWSLVLLCFGLSFLCLRFSLLEGNVYFVPLYTESLQLNTMFSRLTLKLSRDFGLSKSPLCHNSFLLPPDISSRNPLLDSCPEYFFPRSPLIITYFWKFWNSNFQSSSVSCFWITFQAVSSCACLLCLAHSNLNLWRLSCWLMLACAHNVVTLLVYPNGPCSHHPTPPISSANNQLGLL